MKIGPTCAIRPLERFPALHKQNMHVRSRASTIPDLRKDNLNHVFSQWGRMPKRTLTFGKPSRVFIDLIKYDAARMRNPQRLELNPHRVWQADDTAANLRYYDHLRQMHQPKSPEIYGWVCESLRNQVLL